MAQARKSDGEINSSEVNFVEKPNGNMEMFKKMMRVLTEMMDKKLTCMDKKLTDMKKGGQGRIE